MMNVVPKKIKKKKSTTKHKKKKHKKKRTTPEGSLEDPLDVGHVPGKRWKTTTDDDGHHNTASRKHASAQETRKAHILERRGKVLIVAKHSALRKQAIAINLRTFAHSVKRERAKGPRPADLPPRLTLGFRYDTEPRVSLFDAVRKGKLATIKKTFPPDSTSLEAANEANRLQGQFPRGSLLHVAAQCGSLEIVEYLLKNGADVHIQDDLGNIPLHRATIRGDAKIVKTLLTYDVKEQRKQLDTRNVDNLTSVQIAIQYGWEKIRNMCINYLKLEKASMSTDDRTIATELAGLKNELEAIKKAQETKETLIESKTSVVLEASKEKVPVVAQKPKDKKK